MWTYYLGGNKGTEWYQPLPVVYCGYVGHKCGNEARAPWESTAAAIGRSQGSQYLVGALKSISANGLHRKQRYATRQTLVNYRVLFCRDGEEERDLFIRIRALSYQVWYIHQLMASHYDLKKKTIKQSFFSDSSVSIWIPLIKAIKENNISSYLFVYRATLFPLLLDLMTIYYLFFGTKGFVIGLVCKLQN